jgi:flagellar biogenesis protein FliO
MVTPEIVRVAFLRRIGRSLVISFAVKALIISALDVVRWSLCLAAIWFLMRFRSSRVGDGKSIRALIISRGAVFAFNVRVPLKILVKW